VATIPVNSEHVSIPSGEEHVFMSAIPIEGMFGKYKAFLSIEYGSTERASIQDTSFFYVFPLKKMLIILGIISIIAIIGAWFFHKKYIPDEVDDSDQLTFHVRNSQSEAKDHDVNLKSN